jgi:hypothetical protein
MGLITLVLAISFRLPLLVVTFTLYADNADSEGHLSLAISSLTGFLMLLLGLGAPVVDYLLDI